MKRLALSVLLISGLLGSCARAIPATHPALSQYQLAITTPTLSPSHTFAPQPEPTLTQTLTLAPALTSTPLPEHNLVLERLAQLGGSIRGITIAGDLVYVGMGLRVGAFDLSRPASPRLVDESQPLPGLVSQLLALPGANSPHLLVGAGKYLVVLGTSSLSRLVILHQIGLPGPLTSMVLDKVNGVLYAGGSIYQALFEYSGFIAALDISQQDGPSLLASVTLPDPPFSLALAEGSLFAGTYSYTGGLYHIQLKTPGVMSTPHLVIASSTDSDFTPYSMQVVGERLYAGVNLGFQAYDITDPDQPVLVWKEFVGFMARGFSFYGSQIDIFGWGAAGAYIPGQATLTPPEPVSGSSIGVVASITTSHNDDFLVAFHDLEIYSSTDLELLGIYQPPVISILGVAADDRIVYVVDGGAFDGRDNATLRLFSLPDLEGLSQVQTDIPSSCCWFSGIAVEGDRAYLAATDGLLVYDLNSPVPTLSQKLDIFSGSLYSIAAARFSSQRVLFTAQESADISSLVAYDLTDLAHPVMLGNPLSLDHGRIDRMVWNNASLYALSTATREGDSDLIYSVEFRDRELKLQASLELPGSIFSMAVDDGNIALAGTQGLSIVSHADPAAPRLLAQVALPEPGRWVAILRDQVVVVSGGDYGAAKLLVFDVARPATPRQTKAMDIAFSSGFLWSNSVSEPYIVLASGLGGLDLFNYTLPSPALHTCLDRQAVPLVVPPREQPLEVRFISEGNIWVWDDGSPARQISDTGDALRFTFSPDGQVIAFERPVGDYPYGQYKIELWAIDRDGSDLRQLVSAGQFDGFLPACHEAWMANVPTDYHWFTGTHELAFGVYPWINAVGAGQAADGYWIVDADTLQLKKWADPDFIDPYGPKEIPSPNGRLFALVDVQSIGLLNADGSIIHKDALTYPANRNAEGPGWGPPEVVWSPDSRLLKVVVWDEDVFDDSFSAWVIPTDGSPARKLHTFSGMAYFSSISPSQEYIAYLRRVRRMSNEHELHLAKFDGSEDIIYAKGYQLYFQGWAPDAYHFTYDQFATRQPMLGSLCGDPVPLVDSSESPATQISWVDAQHFLFIAGQEGQLPELRLGQVGAESMLIGPFIGEGAYFELRHEGQDAIVP